MVEIKDAINLEIKPPDDQPMPTAHKRFTKEEDDLIKDLVENKKISPWSEVAKHLPGRNANQCRDRYNNYLYTKTKKDPWTHQEDLLIVEKYKEFGPRWVLISQFLPGRSGMNIKNRWHKALTKYHGIKHNESKLERRSKNIKWEKNEPPFIVYYPSTNVAVSYPQNQKD